MNPRHIFIYCSALLMFTFILTGCFLGEKSKTKKVAGTWQMINTWDNNASSTEDEYWQFDNGTFSRLYGLPPVESGEAAQYFIQQKLSKSLLTIDYGMNSAEIPHGTWEIIKLKKTEMVIERTDGGKILREFIKDEDQ